MKVEIIYGAFEIGAHIVYCLSGLHSVEIIESSDSVDER
jgi:hypothetical protein